MKPIKNRPYLAFALGASYGLLLGLLALVCCGLGHGTYIPAALTSSPLGLLGIPASLLGGPIVWGILALSLSKGLHYKKHIIFLASIAFRYAVSIFLVFWADYGGWVYLSRTASKVPIALAAWAILFTGGEVILWYCYDKRPIPQTGIQSQSRD